MKLSEALIQTRSDTAQTHPAQPEDEVGTFQARPIRSGVPLIQVTAGGESIGNTPRRTVSKTYDRISDTPRCQRTMIEQQILDRKNHCSGTIIRIDEKAAKEILKRHETMRNRTDIPDIVAPRLLGRAFYAIKTGPFLLHRMPSILLRWDAMQNFTM